MKDEEEEGTKKMSPEWLLCGACFLPCTSVSHTHSVTLKLRVVDNFIATHGDMFDIDTQVVSVLFTPALCMRSKAACSTSSVC